MVNSHLEQLLALRDLLNQHPLFALGILLVVGYAIGKLAGRIGLPEITGFIVAGLPVGESVTGVVPRHMGEDLGLVTEMALGLIALTIGGEFYWVKLKRLGGAIVIITLAQLVASFGIVAVTLFLLDMPLPFALLMGAISSATAPAATVAIVQALRVKGRFVDYLYGVVALDDAGAVVLFGGAYIVARAIGKYFGVSIGARLGGAPEEIRRYLGLCMFPQAGVAIGLVLLIEATPILAGPSGEFVGTIETMVNIVLLSVFVNELAGPPISKYALFRGSAGSE